MDNNQPILTGASMGFDESEEEEAEEILGLAVPINLRRDVSNLSSLQTVSI